MAEPVAVARILTPACDMTDANGLGRDFGIRSPGRIIDAALTA
jgi:hypothetical protein